MVVQYVTSTVSQHKIEKKKKAQELTGKKKKKERNLVRTCNGYW